jgi:hypothetical protein
MVTYPLGKTVLPHDSLRRTLAKAAIVDQKEIALSIHTAEEFHHFERASCSFASLEDRPSALFESRP